MKKLAFLILLLTPFVVNANCVKVDISGGTPSPACAVDEVCMDGPGTKNIDGLDVYAECWQCQAEFVCVGSTFVEEPYCQELVDQGCSPTSQVCDDVDNTCTNFYNCPVGGGTPTGAMDCGSNTYGLDGLTFDTSYQANTDFGTAASSIGVAEEMAKDMDTSFADCVPDTANPGEYICSGDITIFTGQNLKCRVSILGFRDCCKDSGWGLDTRLAACDAEEEQLGYMKQGNQCKYVGSYCSERESITRTCLERTKSYCCFNSQLAKIIQIARHSQLGISWGSDRSPNCSGMTQDELASLDFSLIDFSPYFDTVLANIADSPSSADMGQYITDYINRITGTGCQQPC